MSMLLLTQWLSLTHAIAHATQACHESAAASGHCDERDAAGSHRPAWSDIVMGVATHHDDSSPLCRLLDHLCHASPVPSVPEIARHEGVHPLPEAARIERWASPALGHYSARAPPARG